MENIGFIIFILCFLSLPIIAIWGFFKFLKNFFQELRADKNHHKKQEKADKNYYISRDRVNEYHQYAFYMDRTKDAWHHECLEAFQISRQMKISYTMFPKFVDILGRYRMTELSKFRNDSRFNLKEKIVITENHTYFFRKIIILIHYLTFILIYSTLFLMLSLPFTIPIFGDIVLLYFLLLFLIFNILLFLFGKHFNLIRIYKKLSQQSMESLGFEKSFDAFSRDPVEARMIITPAFMDRLEEFSEKWNLKGKIRIIWEKDTFTLLLKGDIEKYGKESDGSYTLVKSMEEILNLGYYSLPQANTNNS